MSPLDHSKTAKKEKENEERERGQTKNGTQQTTNGPHPLPPPPLPSFAPVCAPRPRLTAQNRATAPPLRPMASFTEEEGAATAGGKGEGRGLVAARTPLHARPISNSALFPRLFSLCSRYTMHARLMRNSLHPRLAMKERNTLSSESAKAKRGGERVGDGADGSFLFFPPPFSPSFFAVPSLACFTDKRRRAWNTHTHTYTHTAPLRTAGAKHRAQPEAKPRRACPAFFFSSAIPFPLASPSLCICQHIPAHRTLFPPPFPFPSLPPRSPSSALPPPTQLPAIAR